MNRVVLVGNLTRDPELFHTESGVPYALFRIAVPRNISATKAKEKNVPDADFFNVITWRESALFCNKYFTKGRLIGVDGKLSSHIKKNKETDESQFFVEVVAENVRALDYVE
jgi:single-strand DNA-binding protein